MYSSGPVSMTNVGLRTNKISSSIGNGGSGTPVVFCIGTKTL